MAKKLFHHLSSYSPISGNRLAISLGCILLILPRYKTATFPQIQEYFMQYTET